MRKFWKREALQRWKLFFWKKQEIVVSDVRFPAERQLCRKLYEMKEKRNLSCFPVMTILLMSKLALGYKALICLKPVDKKVLNKVVQKAVEEYTAENGEKVCENREREEQKRF